jgi:RNA binding exosome subunit
MRLAHNIVLSVFIKPEEDAQSIEKAFLSLVPLDLAQEKIKLERTTAEGFEQRKIKILTIRLTKHRHIQAVLERLNENLSETEKERLRTENRTHDLTFYMRLDKKAAQEGKYSLTDGGECIHIKLVLAAYPKTDEAAKAIVPLLFPKSI